MPIARMERAIADLRNGKFVIIVDDPERENEGDLCIAGQFVSPEAVNFIVREARGLLCVAMAPEWVDRLQLPLMVDPDGNTAPFGTAFTLPVEAREGVTTGISAHDRAITIRTLADPTATRADFTVPGHVFPLRARPGGVFERRGQTEASVDLARLAGLHPVVAICEIMADDGQMARLPELERFAARHDIALVSVADIEAYRRAKAEVAQPVVESQLPTEYGLFRLRAYGGATGEPDLALLLGDLDGDPPPLVRLHSECLTGDAFGSLRCDCGDQLEQALARIGDEGRGVLLYLRQEGRGIGLLNKLRAYHLQDGGLDTVDANQQLGFPSDARDYATAAAILRQLGITQLRLLTNNPAKAAALASHGITVIERVPLEVPANVWNRRYLEAKRDRLGHWLDLAEAPAISPGAGLK